MGRYCCDRMERDLLQSCPDHPDRRDCPDCLIVESASGFGLIVHDGGHSAVRIAFCPWCGARLSDTATEPD